MMIAKTYYNINMGVTQKMGWRILDKIITGLAIMGWLVMALIVLWSFGIIDLTDVLIWIVWERS